MEKISDVMSKESITEDVIVSLMFYGIISGWSTDELKEKYEYLGIPKDIVNETLNRGIE